MPDYKVLPAPNTVTIEHALKAAKNTISLPARAITICASIFGIVLPCCGYTLWLLPISLIIGGLMSLAFTLWRTPKWRIWAYAGVQDIHELQRAAELDKFLPLQSPRKRFGIMNSQQKELLAKLQLRFDENSTFVDDPGVESTSYICDNGELRIAISDIGIEINPGKFFDWTEIQNEGVVTKSESRMYSAAGTITRNYDCFCFATSDTQIEIPMSRFVFNTPMDMPMSQLNVSSGQLNHLLYIHRGRYELNIALSTY